MHLTDSPRCLHTLILILALALSSCGGGTNTAGAGGSGVGGTGITTVTGNVSQVVALNSHEKRTVGRRLLARAVDWLSTPVNAQATRLGNIRVFGGGRSTTTDDSGNFVLEDVTPSHNFVLHFILEDDQGVALPIGAVPEGARARVKDIVVDTERGVATAGDVEVEENDIPSDKSDNAPGNVNNPGNSQNANRNNNAGGTNRNNNPGGTNRNNNPGNASGNNKPDNAGNAPRIDH